MRQGHWRSAVATVETPREQRFVLQCSDVLTRRTEMDETRLVRAFRQWLRSLPAKS